MANLALALTFILAWFTNGAVVLRGTFAQYVFDTLSTSQCFLILALANYWIPAVVIYIVLRIANAGHWLRSCRGIQILLGLGNLIIILLGLTIIYALTFREPGADGLVYLGAAVFAFPALASYAAAFLWLLYRSFTRKKGLGEGWGAFEGDGIVLTLSLVGPLCIVGALMFTSRSNPANHAEEAKKVFAEKCQEAGEVIVERAKGVTSIYLDPDSGSYFAKNGKGGYKAIAYGEVGQPLVNNGLLQYYEKKSDQEGGTESAAEYRKHTLENLKGEPVAEVSSQYGVFHRRLTSDYEENMLKIHGEEVTIMSLDTGKVIATQKYFTNRDGEMCGSKGVDPSVDGFIQRTLHLTKRFQGSQRFSRSP